MVWAMDLPIKWIGGGLTFTSAVTRHRLFRGAQCYRVGRSTGGSVCSDRADKLRVNHGPRQQGAVQERQIDRLYITHIKNLTLGNIGYV